MKGLHIRWGMHKRRVHTFQSFDLWVMKYRRAPNFTYAGRQAIKPGRYERGWQYAVTESGRAFAASEARV
jgi:hypothetical protein